MGSLRGQREQNLKEIQYKLKDWIEYLEHTWAFFEEDIKKFETWVNTQNFDPNKPEDKKKLDELFTRYTLSFPHRHLSAIFMKLYVVFESELDTFNYWLKYFRHIELDVTTEEKAKRNFDNFFLLKELFKKLNLEVNQLNPEYSRMQQFKKLRDNLAHSKENSILSNPNDRVFRQFLENTDGIVITSTFIVQEGYLHSYFLHSKAIIIDLKETISRFYEKAFDLGYGERD